MMIAIQKNKNPEIESEVGSNFDFPILGAIKSCIENVKLDESFGDPDRARQSLKDMIFLFIDFDINKLELNTEKQIVSQEEKINNFI